MTAPRSGAVRPRDLSSHIFAGAHSGRRAAELVNRADEPLGGLTMLGDGELLAAILELPSARHDRVVQRREPPRSLR